MLRKWVPHVRTGETERTSTIVWHVVARKIQKSSVSRTYSWRRPATSATGTHNSARYFGAKPCRDLYTVMHSLKMTRGRTSNQWRSWWRMWLRPLSNFPVPVMTRVAAFRTCNVASGWPSYYSNCGKVARPVWKFLPNCLQKLAQFSIPVAFTLGNRPNSIVGARIVGGGQRRRQLKTPAKLTPWNM